MSTEISWFMSVPIGVLKYFVVDELTKLVEFAASFHWFALIFYVH
jgi:hypothetical protein